MTDDDGSDVEGDIRAAEVSQGLDDDTILILEVAGGAFLGALAIGLIGLLVYKRRFKSKAKSTSGISNESSSDEVRREGLTETVE